MSKYTTEVRYICETYAGYTESQGYGKVDEILTVAAPKVFDFDFPIFDEDYRLGLEKKILRHFYTREISEETVGLWKLRLADKMNVIMPYYNQLYESELLVFNPLGDVDLETTSTTGTTGSTSETKDETQNTSGENNTGTVYKGTDGKNTTYDEDSTRDRNRTSVLSDKGTSNDTTHTEDAYSDTPQGALTDVLNLEYLTNARVIDETRKGETTDDSTTTDTDKIVNALDSTKKESGTQDYTKDVTGTSSGKTVTNTEKGGTSQSTEEYVQKVAGKRSLSSFSSYLIDFRNTFLNIDRLILEELNDLFFNLW